MPAGREEHRPRHRARRTPCCSGPCASTAPGSCRAGSRCPRAPGLMSTGPRSISPSGLISQASFSSRSTQARTPTVHGVPSTLAGRRPARCRRRRVRRGRPGPPRRYRAKAETRGRVVLAHEDPLLEYGGCLGMRQRVTLGGYGVDGCPPIRRFESPPQAQDVASRRVRGPARTTGSTYDRRHPARRPRGDRGQRGVRRAGAAEQGAAHARPPPIRRHPPTIRPSAAIVLAAGRGHPDAFGAAQGAAPDRRPQPARARRARGGRARTRAPRRRHRARRATRWAPRSPSSVEQLARPVLAAVQDQQLGTGHAVQLRAGRAARRPDRDRAGQLRRRAAAGGGHAGRAGRRARRAPAPRSPC